MTPWPEVRDHLNATLRGWSNYFGYGTRLMAYRAVNHYVYERVRNFLRRRHKVPSRGTTRFSDAIVFGKLACCVSATCIWGHFRELDGEVCRKAGCSKWARPV